MTDTLALSRDESREPAHGVSIGEASRVWLRVAALSFGGPAGQIAVMHRILVEEKRWVSESRFMHALNYCMLAARSRGSAARHLYRLADASHARRHHGGRLVHPARHSRARWRSASSMRNGAESASWRRAFFGLKAAVLAIVVEAVIRIGRRSLNKQGLASIGGGGIRGDLLLRRPVSHYHRCGGSDRVLWSARWLSGFHGRDWSRQSERRARRRKPAWRGHPRSRTSVEIAHDARRRALARLVARSPSRPWPLLREPATYSLRSRYFSARWRW